MVLGLEAMERMAWAPESLLVGMAGTQPWHCAFAGCPLAALGEEGAAALRRVLAKVAGGERVESSSSQQGKKKVEGEGVAPGEGDEGYELVTPEEGEDAFVLIRRQEVPQAEEKEEGGQAALPSATAAPSQGSSGADAAREQ